MNTWRSMPRWARVEIAALFVLFTAYRLVFNYVDPGEMGITRNIFTGEIALQDHAGYHVDAPWVLVTVIDVRPQRLCIPSSAHAAVSCRLVQFDVTHYREFIAVEGWRWYWWSNRFSFNSGHAETYRGWRDVMRGYAFSSQPYPFIKVLEQYQ